MLSSYHLHKRCIDACLDCAAACDHCASSCTQENDINMMAKCIQHDMECAVMCYATARLLSLGSEKARVICKICADICEACAAECEKHDSDHCRECAAACKACAEECRKM